MALEEGKEDNPSPGNSSHSLDSFEGEVRDPLSRDSDSICSDEFFDPEALIGEEGPPAAVVQPVSVSVMSEDEPSGEWEGRGNLDVALSSLCPLAVDVEEDVEMTEVDDASKGVAQNKSLIMYMLPQFKIGMDLTRVGGGFDQGVGWVLCDHCCRPPVQVTLPTFILEKKSLLEMYSDFFAHPDRVVA